MFGSSISILHEATTISVRTQPDGTVRITYPRWGRLATGLLTLFVGAGFWLYRLPPHAFHEPLEYTLGILLVAPGLWGIGRALRPRPIVRVSKDELVVYYGLAFLERMVARLPVNTLEVQTSCEAEHVLLYDGRASSRRLLAAFGSLSGAQPRRGAAPLHTLQVRNHGQEEWLGVLGSLLASDVENARLAIAAAVTTRGGRATIAAEPGDNPEQVTLSPESP